MKINNEILDALTLTAKDSSRLRMNFDLRNCDSDTSQRMLNAIEPGTRVPIHRHQNTSETVMAVRGSFEEVLYEECHGAAVDNIEVFKNAHTGIVVREVSRHRINPQEGTYGIQIPQGVWHTIIPLESGTIIFEAKDGAYEPIGEEDILTIDE